MSQIRLPSGEVIDWTEEMEAEYQAKKNGTVRDRKPRINLQEREKRAFERKYNITEKAREDLLALMDKFLQSEAGASYRNSFAAIRATELYKFLRPLNTDENFSPASMSKVLVHNKEFFEDQGFVFHKGVRDCLLIGYNTEDVVFEEDVPASRARFMRILIDELPMPISRLAMAEKLDDIIAEREDKEDILRVLPVNRFLASMIIRNLWRWWSERYRYDDKKEIIYRVEDNK